MITVQDIIKELAKMGLSDIKINYDLEKDMLYYNLNTMAKSDLNLYEDYTLTGRYGYTRSIDPEQDIEAIISDLFWEFKHCLHVRDYYNLDWMELGVKLGLVDKKVETHTTVSYT